VTAKVIAGGVLSIALAGSAEAQVLVLEPPSQTENVLQVPDVVRRNMEGFERNLRGAIESAAAQLNKRLIEAVPNAQFQLQFQALTLVNGVVMPDGDANFWVLIPAIEQTGINILKAIPPTHRTGLDSMFNPNDEYTTYARQALIDALLDQGMNLGIAPDKKLTVIAGELQPQGPSPFLPRSRSLILQISGADLLALRQNRISRDDAKARIKENRY
jgi:hypothetical protein